MQIINLTRFCLAIDADFLISQLKPRSQCDKKPWASATRSFGHRSERRQSQMIFFSPEITVHQVKGTVKADINIHFLLHHLRSLPLRMHFVKKEEKERRKRRRKRKRPTSLANEDICLDSWTPETA